MYKNNFVCSITTNRSPLREFDAPSLNLPVNGNYVVLSDGTEYEILLHNKHADADARVIITIDGKNIFGTDGSLIVAAGTKVHVERFVDNNNLSAGNRLKFIKTTEATAAHRGTRSEDGRVVVEVEYEQIRLTNSLVPNDQLWIHQRLPQQSPFYDTSHYERTIYGSPNTSTNHWPNPEWHPQQKSGDDSLACLFEDDVMERRIVASSATTATNNVTSGFTAPGAKSNQKYSNYTGVFVGDGKKFKFEMTLLASEESIGSKMKVECSSCGAKHPNSDKFCSQCGTSLVIFK